MTGGDRIELGLTRALAALDAECPPRLRAAIHHAVFPGGARIRPRFVLAVAAANGDVSPTLADAGAVAIELLHCASLVHDDLPCFDDAATRRGRASVHRAFGDAIAVLAGDALIVHAFDVLARAATPGDGAWLAAATTTLARAASASGGLVGGQAWESEPAAPSIAYRRAKTGALFEAAGALGAIAVGAGEAPWRSLGARLGEAYQVLDDIADTTSNERALGKPVGRDAALGRPSAVTELGLAGARSLARDLVPLRASDLPRCQAPNALLELLREAIDRFADVRVTA